MNLSRAACLDGGDPELWFPAALGLADQYQAATAARICATCPIQTACRDYATSVGARHGIWGGVWLDMETAHRRNARERTWHHNRTREQEQAS